MKENIKKALKMIKNQHLLDIGRASNLLWLSIGEPITCIDRRGEKVEKGTYALHVQASWRIISYEKKMIKLASSDMYMPKSSLEWTEEFNWDIQGNNLFDEKAREWFDKNAPLVLEECEWKDAGDLLIKFSNNDYLQVFVDCSAEEEMWRIFQCNTKEPHYVGYPFEINLE